MENLFLGVIFVPVSKELYYADVNKMEASLFEIITAEITIDDH